MISRLTLFIFLYLMVAPLSCREKEPMKHLFYLHGMIIESQGINAVSEAFGPYKYQEIIDSLKATGYEVHNEVRTTKTDFNAFCQKVSQQIDQLIEEGVRPNDISVIGASKGGMMAMAISDLTKHPVNYILLGANSNRTEENFDWNLHGRILGIYEKSDAIAGKDYTYWIERSSEAKEFQQLEINTGLGHGFLYTPLEAWLDPAKNWINGNH